MSDKKTLKLREAVCKLKLDCNKYYNINKMLSYNKMFNVVMGGRGIGKTTQLMIWLINRAIKLGRKFIYVRRNVNECKQQKNLMSKYLDFCKFIGDGNSGGVYMYGNDVVGYLKCLSVSADYKSVDFDDVDYILYDEAILMPGQPKRYLKDEITVLLEFLSTVFRTRTDYKVFIIGNNLDFFNPYCRYFNVHIFNRVFVGEELYIEYANNSVALMEAEKETPLYKLTKGTTYHEYHYANAVLTSTERKTVKLQGNEKYMFSIVINNYTLLFYKVQNDSITVECKNKILDNNKAFVLIDNGELNYYFKREFKASLYYNLFFYYYGRQLMFGVTQDANSLVDMLYETIK